MKLFAKQFISGKLSNVARANYETIAKSPNITESEIESVKQVFGGNQPLSTEIHNFNGAWLVSPIDKDYIGILRQERSLNKEVKRQFFLYEHYWVFKKVDFLGFNRIWLLTLGKYKQEEYSAFNYLDDFYELDNGFLSKIISSIINELFTPSSNLSAFVVGALSKLLQNNQLVIRNLQVDAEKAVAALNLTLPSNLVNNYKTYIGNNLPRTWNYNIAVLDNFKSGSGISSVSSNLSLSEKLDDSYTRIIYKIINSNKEYWPDFFIDLDKLNYDQLEGNAELEKSMGNALFTQVGLHLVEVDISLRKEKMDDLHLAWKKLADLTKPDDINLLLPKLLRGKLKWDKDDFSSLKTNIIKNKKSIYDCFSDFLWMDSNSFSSFIELWLNNEPSQDELEFIEAIYLQFKHSKLHTWINIFNKIDIFNANVIAQVIEQREINKVEGFKLTLIILNKIQDKSQVQFLLKSRIEPEDQSLFLLFRFLYSIIEPINDKENENSFTSLMNHFYSNFQDGFYAFLANLAKFAINFRIDRLLTKLIFGLPFSDSFIQFIDSGRIDDLEDWARSTQAIPVITSYIKVLYERNKGEEAKTFLTQILIANPNKYKVVMNSLQELTGKKKYSAISLAYLSQINLENRAEVLTNYISISNPLSPEEIRYFEDFLMEIPYYHIIIDQFERVYSIFEDDKNLVICQLILEHQIRDAIINKKSREFIERMKILESLSKPKKDLLKNRIIHDYLVALSRSTADKEFLHHFLFAPFSEVNSPRVLKKIPATSILFIENYKKIFTDVRYRILLYQWASDEYMKYS